MKSVELVTYENILESIIQELYYHHIYILWQWVGIVLSLALLYLSQEFTFISTLLVLNLAMWWFLAWQYRELVKDVYGNETLSRAIPNSREALSPTVWEIFLWPLYGRGYSLRLQRAVQFTLLQYNDPETRYGQYKDTRDYQRPRPSQCFIQDPRVP